MNRLLVALAGITAVGTWLLSGGNVRSAQQGPVPSVQYLDGNAFQLERAYSLAVMTQGGKIV